MTSKDPRSLANQAAAAYGIGYLWRDPKTGVERALSPADVTVVTRGEPRDGELFARMDERRKVAEEIRAALIERSQDWPKETGEWREGWRAGLVDGADTAAARGMPTKWREAYEAAVDKAFVDGLGNGEPQGLLGKLPVFDARIDRPVDWDKVQLTVKVGAGVPDGIIRDDTGRPIGVGVAGYPHPVGKAACEACGKLLLFNLAVGIILHDDPAGDAACWAPQTTNAAPAQVTRGITIEHPDNPRPEASTS